MEQNTQLRKQVSDLMTQQQQQVRDSPCAYFFDDSAVLHSGYMNRFFFFLSKVSNHANLEHNLASAKETVNVLEQKIEQDKVSVYV